MTTKKQLTSTIGVLSALSFSIGSLAAEPAQPDPFEAEVLPAGFMATSTGVARVGDEDKDKEGSCGEGSCGEEDDKDEEGSCGEGSCGEGEGDDKDEEGSCGEGTCGVA